MLFHIVSGDAFRNTIGPEYRPAAFARERFIHCSYAPQVVSVANRLFAGVRGLVLLEIEPAKVPHRIVEENLEGGRELFPHIYGPLPLTAVIRVHPFPCDGQGRFGLPAGIDAR